MVFTDPSVKCWDFVPMYVHFSLLLAALPSTTGLMSDTAPTVGIPGFLLQLLHHPDHFSASLPYVQVLAELISPAQLCYNIQQPFTPMNTLHVRHVMNDQITSTK